ncbi:MAG: hypothetical protein FVQ77_02390 [Cytophagales bacterium]|nr:hypothetical protein [Cytophagales bacterium]
MRTQQQKLDFDKVWLMFQETKEQIKESDRILTEKFQETKEQAKETDKKLQKLGEMYGGLSKNIGESVEDFFFHSFERNPVIGKIRFKNVVQYMKTDKVEYDIALTNGKYIAIIEVRHKFHPADIDVFIDTRLSLLRKEFAKFNPCKVIACIAGFVIPKTTKIKAIEAGLYVFTQAGENIKILNDKNFKPKEF